MEEKIKSLYERYVDACVMCSKDGRDKCDLKMFIEDFCQVLEIKD